MTQLKELLCEDKITVPHFMLSSKTLYLINTSDAYRQTTHNQGSQPEALPAGSGQGGEGVGS